MTADQATATAEMSTDGATSPRLAGPQPITGELIDAVSTSNCGWTRRQVEILGASWPLEAGWRERLVSEQRVLSADQVEALYKSKKPKHTEGPVDPVEIAELPCPWCSRPVQHIEHGGRIKEFCSKRHKTAFNNSLSKLSIATARIMRTPGALRKWAEGGVNPAPGGAEDVSRTSEGQCIKATHQRPPAKEGG